MKTGSTKAYGRRKIEDQLILAAETQEATETNLVLAPPKNRSKKSGEEYPDELGS
jgi:hypothetical protein